MSCASCGKKLKVGEGHQVVQKGRTDRYCSACYVPIQVMSSLEREEFRKQYGI